MAAKRTEVDWSKWQDYMDTGKGLAPSGVEIRMMKDLLDQKTKERVSTLMEEVAKTSELKDSLQCEVHELRNNLENVTREVADKAASNERLVGELAQLQNSIDQISKDKNSISDAKQVIEKEQDAPRGDSGRFVIRLE